LDVRDVGVALWRQRPLVVLILVITGAAVAAGVLLAPKTYAATATISAARSPSATAAPEELHALRSTLAELASSRAVVDEARDQVHAERDVDTLRHSIEGHWVRGTILVDVTAEDRDPDVAAELANAVAAVLSDEGVTSRLTDGAVDGVFVITTSDVAAVPDSFTSPDLRVAIGLGVLIALGLAVVGAVSRDRRTHTVDDAAGVEEAATAPLLAHLVPPEDLTAMPALTPGTADADMFRHLRLALQAQAAVGSSRVVVAGITSGDVNVWIGANVAIALARTGRRVLLVDGRMGERFGVPVEDAPNTPGLYDVMMGAALESAVSPGPVDLLRVLPAGTWGEEPVAGLIARRFTAVMDVAAADFEHVVVLGPPLEICDDSRLMAADASMVVALVAGSVSATALRAHADRVRALAGRLLGVVLVAPPSERAVA
jgi:capsular polysaccharide biosynthesis protein